MRGDLWIRMSIGTGGTGGDRENTKHLYNICTMPAQRLRRWTNVVQMLYKCFGC